jgi:hypothetical protein
MKCIICGKEKSKDELIDDEDIICTSCRDNAKIIMDGDSIITISNK